jgi:hypothetical protein
MTDNLIMEEISRSYLELLANNTGYFPSVTKDFGTDLTIRKAKYCAERKRILTIGKSIDIQLKAVSEKYVAGSEDTNLDSIRYVLEVKNYNDLIVRANENGICMPLILCVFIIPNDRNDWFTLNPTEMIIRKCAYWYKVPSGEELSKNTTNITIEIPKKNIVSTNFYDEIFATLE